MYKFRDLYPNMGSFTTYEATLSEPTELDSISHEAVQEHIIAPADFSKIILGFVGLLIVLGLIQIL